MNTPRWSSILLHKERHLDNKDRHYLRVKDWKKFFQTIDSKEQAGDDIQWTFHQIYPVIWRRTLCIHQRENQPRKIWILNIYHPNAKVPTFIKETLLQVKAHIDSHTILVGHFNTPLSSLVMSLKQKLNRDTVKVTEIMKQKDFTIIYSILYPKTKWCVFFSGPRGTFSHTDHIVGLKTGLNRKNKIEILPCTLSD